MEAHVNAHVASLPSGIVRIHMKLLLGILSIHKGLDVRKVITQWVVSAFLGDIIGVEASHTIGGCEGGVAPQKGSLAGEAVDHAGSGVALFDALNTEAFGALHTVVGVLVNGLDVVRVVEGHFGVVLVLDFGIGETISYSQSGEV